MAPPTCQCQLILHRFGTHHSTCDDTGRCVVVGRGGLHAEISCPILVTVAIRIGPNTQTNFRPEYTVTVSMMAGPFLSTLTVNSYVIAGSSGVW